MSPFAYRETTASFALASAIPSAFGYLFYTSMPHAQI
jgi:hypothetical protein